LTRNNRLPVVALAFALAAVAAANLGSNPAAAAADSSRKVSRHVLVTLQVFSGRPDPSWTISADEEQELVRRLQGLSAIIQPPAMGDLGYRGFHIINDAGEAQLPSEVVVMKGVVTVRDGQGISHYTDANGIETWLLEQARRRGFGALVADQR